MVDSGAGAGIFGVCFGWVFSWPDGRGDVALGESIFHDGGVFAGWCMGLDKAGSAATLVGNGFVYGGSGDQFGIPGAADFIVNECEDG